MSEERLEKLKKDLTERFDEEIKRYKEWIEGERERLIREIDDRIEIIKHLPINVLEFDVAEIREEEGTSSVGIYNIRLPEPGRYKFIVLGKKVGERR